jgi:hypothetical protein
MLSNSASLDPYVPTPGAAPSSTAYYGPRFDYDPVTLLPRGLLIEEQRTNALTYSDQFDNAAWVKVSTTVFPNQNPAETSGAERRATGATAMLGTSTPATYNTSTGVGTATRTDPSNSSGVTFTVPNASSLYAVNISNTGATTMQIRINALNGTVVATILPGVGGTFPVSGMSAGTPIIALTSSTDGTTASFTVNSVRELVGGSIISPDGTANADKVVENTASAPHAVYAAFTYAAGTTYAASVYAKAAERSWIYLGADTSAAEAVFFNLATGTVGSQGTGYVGSIQNVGNGWYRCTVIITQATALPPNFFVVGLATGDNTASYTGNGTSGVFLYGAQLEVGTFATSYIPTIASTVTRSADVATITGSLFSQWWNANEGAFLLEYAQGTGTTARAATVASDGTNSNTIEMYIDGSNDATTLPFYGVYVAGAAQAALSFAVAAQNATHKMGTAYQANNFAGSVDGSTAATDTSGALPTVNRLNIGSSGTAAGAFANGHIRSIRYVPVRAADFQLQALTAPPELLSSNIYDRFNDLVLDRAGQTIEVR